MISSTQNMFCWPLLVFPILLFLLTMGLCILLWLTAYWNSFSIFKPFVECHLTIWGLSYMNVPLNIHSTCAHRYLKLSNFGVEYVGRNNKTTKRSRKWRLQLLLKTIMVENITTTHQCSSDIMLHIYTQQWQKKPMPIHIMALNW